MSVTRKRGRRVTIALFSGYLVLLVWAVVWKLDMPQFGDGTMRQIKLVPFVAAGGLGGNAPVEVLANLVLFVPFGVFLALLARHGRVLRSITIIAAASLCMEIAQYVFAVGSSDVTDLLVNTAGGALGIATVALARRVFRDRADPVLVRWCAIGLACAALAVGVSFTPAFEPDHTGPGEPPSPFTVLEDVHVVPDK